MEEPVPVENEKPPAAAPLSAAKGRSIFRRIIVGTAVLFTTLSLAAIIITLAFGDRVKEFAIAELNKKLSTEVKVEGPIRFSVIRHFPFASVCFEKVSIMETLADGGQLLQCDEITLMMNITTLWSSEKVIDKITASNGSIIIRIDRSGNGNFNILKKSDAAGDASLRISDAVLSNFKITYENESSGQEYAFFAERISLHGDFASSKFTLDLEAEATSKYLRIKGTDYLPGRSLKLSGEIDCDIPKNQYTFRNTTIEIYGTTFTLSGTMAVLEKGTELALNLHGEQQNFDELLQLLPPSVTKRISAYRVEGRITWSAQINGLASETSVPQLNATYQIDRGSFGTEDYNDVLKQVALNGTYTNGTAGNSTTSMIAVDKFSATVAGNELQGSFVLRNFRVPEVDVMLNGEADLASVYPLFKNENVASVTGLLDFRGCYYRGPISSLTSAKVSLDKINAGGMFTLNDLSITTKQAEYDHINGAFEIKDNSIQISDCIIKAGSSDLKLIGRVSNLIPFLFTELSDSTEVKQKVGLEITLASGQLNWQDMVGTSGEKNKAGNYEIPAVFYRLAGSVNGSLKEFNYEKFSAHDVRGKVLFMPGQIYFNDFGLQAEEGSVNCNGKLDISQSNRSRLELAAKINSVNLTQLFYEFNNFDQTVLTHQKLKGSVTADVSLEAAWKNNKLDPGALHAIADISVVNGELNNFEPMLALATFVKLKELRNIRFSKMENQIEIRNRKVYIPDMNIFSNALNVHLSGTHGFDNIIDYKVQLDLLKLLTDKFRKSSRAADGEEQSTEGFLNLYLTMTGPASDPVIKYDKRTVKQKIATELAQEKQELKEILKREFSEQSTSQRESNEWKPQGGLKYFEFESDSNSETTEDEADHGKSSTVQNQQKAFDEFKSLFKKEPKNTE